MSERAASAKVRFEEWRKAGFVDDLMPWPYEYHSEVCDFADWYGAERERQGMEKAAQELATKFPWIMDDSPTDFAVCSAMRDVYKLIRERGKPE